MPSRRQFNDNKPSDAMNEWHRADSIARFIPRAEAERLTCIDIDLMEYSISGGKTKLLLLHEFAIDNGQQNKQTWVLHELSRRSGIPSMLTLVTLSDDPNPANPDFPDVEAMRWRWVWRPSGGPTGFEKVSAGEYAQRLNEFLKKVRTAV